MRIGWQPRSLRVCWVVLRGVGGRWNCFNSQFTPNFVLCPICLWPWENKQNMSPSSCIIWVARRIRVVIKFCDVGLMITIVSSISWVVSLQSEMLSQKGGWTFADALARATLSVVTLADGVVDTSHLPTCYYSFLISHWLLNVGIIRRPSLCPYGSFQRAPVHERVSWGYCVLVFDSSGEPAGLPGVSDFCVPGGSETELEVGCTKACEEGAGAAKNVPMEYQSSMGQFYFCIMQHLSRFTSLWTFRSSWSSSS